MGRVHKEGFGMIWLEKRMLTIERNGESELKQKLLTPASLNNGIKTDVVVVVVVVDVVSSENIIHIIMVLKHGFKMVF